MSAIALDEQDRALCSTVHRRLLASEGAESLVDAPAGAVCERIAALLALENPLLGGDRRDRLVRMIFDDVVGLGALEPLLCDPTVDEIMVNGAGRCYVERAGVLQPVPLALDDDGIVRLVQRILAPLGLRLDRSAPMVDARLVDGSRLHAVIPPLAVDGPCLTIRRFGARQLDLEAFGLGDHAAAFVRGLVARGANVVVAGGTGSGKTTLLNALAGLLDARQRIVTIEETAELRLPLPHVVRLEARPANAEGAGAVTVRELVRAALRMRPDRLVVGEVRGGEALDLIQALNTGHDGSMSTVHANGPLDALRRLSTLALMGGTGLPHGAVSEQLRAAVDIVVQVARATGGARAVVAAAEVVDAPGPLAVRPLLARTSAGVRVVGEPQRVARSGLDA